jgi:hypothetical protein
MIILKYISEEEGEVIWNKFIWLAIETRSGLFREICDQLSAWRLPNKGLNVTELSQYLVQQVISYAG